MFSTGTKQQRIQAKNTVRTVRAETHCSDEHSYVIIKNLFVRNIIIFLERKSSRLALFSAEFWLVCCCWKEINLTRISSIKSGPDSQPCFQNRQSVISAFLQRFCIAFWEECWMLLWAILRRVYCKSCLQEPSDSSNYFILGQICMYLMIF